MDTQTPFQVTSSALEAWQTAKEKVLALGDLAATDVLGLAALSDLTAHEGALRLILDGLLAAEVVPVV